MQLRGELILVDKLPASYAFCDFLFFSLSLEGRLSSELQLHRHRVM